MASLFWIVAWFFITSFTEMEAKRFQIPPRSSSSQTLAASFTEKTENMDRKSYNVNTKSGRKNIRNKYQNDYQNKSPKEKNELDEMIFWGRAILFVIAMVVCILIVAFGGKIN